MSHADGADIAMTPAAVAALLRALAMRAEREPNLAAAIVQALEQSGLLAPGEDDQAGQKVAKSRGRKSGSVAKTPAGKLPAAPIAAPDPFAVWRTQGEDGLRAVLAVAPLAELRAIVRAHRLDPARISARWTARERLAALIFDQVRARMRHGRAFERV